MVIELKIDIFCKVCNRWYSEELDLLDSEKEEVSEPDDLELPSPKKQAGFKTFSLVHEDHILVADIDYNGHIRFEKIIKRLGIDLEKMVSKISTIILDHVERENSSSIFLHTPNQSIHRIVMGSFHQMQLNIPPKLNSQLEVNYDRKKFSLYNEKVNFNFCWVGAFNPSEKIASCFCIKRFIFLNDHF